MKRRLLEHARFWRAECQRRWWLYLPLAGIWALALSRLFVDPQPQIPLLFNWTPSLPYRVGWLQPAVAPLQRGELIVYRFNGATADFAPGLQGQPLFKQVRGLPGDHISVQGRQVSVNGQPVGLAKPFTASGHALATIRPGVIPPGQLYVQGTSPDAFDSRYQASGLVRAEHVIGRVRPLW
ncbi:conjugative transfer signal peptidase TraF [Pseudomonas sp. 18175]|uniref:conjugative transfer signal peptidase TraF n=1 Tax=Pseudomonas sp. 18175 TaxID=3390056 RepID=UPI003D1DA8F0